MQLRDGKRWLSKMRAPFVWRESLLQFFPGFVAIGALGFLVDAGILTAVMNGFDANHYAARAISFTVAVTATWYMNRRWVFKRIAAQKSSREYTAYLVVQTVGAMINLSVFVAAIELAPALSVTPLVPLALGAAVALLFNFSASSRFVFSAGTDGENRARDFPQ